MNWPDVAHKLLSLPEMVLDKLRINVVIIAGLVTFIIVDFGDKLIDKLPESVGPEVIALLIGTGIGGLIAAMIRMFESPNVPAELHERLMKSFWKEGETP